MIYVSYDFNEKVILVVVSVGLNMILNDVRLGNCRFLSCGFLLVVVVIEMKL